MLSPSSPITKTHRGEGGAGKNDSPMIVIIKSTFYDLEEWMVEESDVGLGAVMRLRMRLHTPFVRRAHTS